MRTTTKPRAAPNGRAPGRFESKRGILLDVGCGASKQEGFVGMDHQALPGVDVVHSWNDFPWPFADESVLTIVASHVVEHVSPIDGHFLRWMDEAWRVLKPGRQLALVTPYAGSPGYWWDPTHCLTDGAEVLTESGFKRMQSVAVGENVLTLDPQTGASEYAPAVRIYDEPYEGEIVRFKNARMDIAVTPNHDLLWHTYQPGSKLRLSPAETFESLCGFGRRGIATVRDWDGAEPPRILEWLAGDFMELLGWLLSGGVDVRGSYRRVQISQSMRANSAKYERIRNLLERLGLRYRAYPNVFNIDSPALYELMSEVGPSTERFIPLDAKKLSAPLLRRLLEGLMLGDGERHPNGIGATYTSTSQRLASDVNEIALKCGSRSSISLRKGKEFLSRGRISTRRDQFRVSVTPDRPMLYPVPQREDYSGRITCVQAARNHTIMTRQNGKCAWVGNCNGCTEMTWAYFDPEHESGFYGFYRPKPWRIEVNTYHREGNLEVVLRKRAVDGEVMLGGQRVAEVPA